MKYFFILGNNPSLSVAELESVLQTEELIYLKNNNICLFDSETDLAPRSLISRLGGCIKIGEVCEENIDASDLLSAIEGLLTPQPGKFHFGISLYARRKVNTAKLAMGIKKFLKGLGYGSRWVTSREPQLSSVVVEQNRLLENGIELVLMQNGNNFYIGRTLAVQAFKDLSFRDYKRPARDDKSGMLPPKLAQLMLNLSGSTENEVLLDPFCGSGTIINEAILMGYKRLVATDASPKAIADTKKNIDWLLDNYRLDGDKLSTNDLELKIMQENVKSIGKRLGANSVDAIITEPYLGPQRGSLDINKVVSELNSLYTDALKQFYRLLKPGGRVVMVWPLIVRKQNKYQLDPDTNKFKLTPLINGPIKKHLPYKPSSRQSIVYGRPGQKVWREIIKLTKN